MTTGKTFPEPRRRRGCIEAPCNVRSVQAETEDGQTETHYSYEWLQIKDTGQALDGQAVLEQSRGKVMTRLNQACNGYIVAHYDLGSQNTLQALYNDPDTSQSTREAIKPAFDWIKGEVLPYYYSKKQSVRQAVDMEALSQVVWDFEQFTSTKPDVTLEGLFAS